MLNTMHLFAGGGGGLLADLILGHNPIAAIEWEPYCCDILRQRAADGWFPDLRVHEGDVRLFDPSEYKGRVDILAAGFPCQDLSNAGNRAGLGEGTRSGLYREVLRIAGDIQPRYIFLENVSAIITVGVGIVIGDLAALGYDCRWTCIPASAAGAPHFRDRWWCLCTRRENVANPKGFRYIERGKRGNILEKDGRQNRLMRSIASIAGKKSENLADTMRQRQQGQREQIHPSDCTAHSQRKKSDALNECIGYERSAESDVGCVVDGLATRMVSGWWEAEPRVGRVTGKMKDRVGMLKALGNGQVPMQAALAWTMLGGPA